MFHATVLHPQYVVNDQKWWVSWKKKTSGLSSLAGLPRCYPSSASPRHATLPEDALTVWRPSIRPMLCLLDPFSSHAITGMPVCSANVDHTWNDHGREYWSQGFHFLENNLPNATVGQCRLEHLRTMVYWVTVDKGNPAPVNLENIHDKKEKTVFESSKLVNPISSINQVIATFLAWPTEGATWSHYSIILWST